MRIAYGDDAGAGRPAHRSGRADDRRRRSDVALDARDGFGVRIGGLELVAGARDLLRGAQCRRRRQGGDRSGDLGIRRAAVPHGTRRARVPGGRHRGVDSAGSKPCARGSPDRARIPFDPRAPGRLIVDPRRDGGRSNRDGPAGAGHRGRSAGGPEDSGPSRPQQYASALVAMAEQVLSGGSGGSTRPRPRLYATVDVNALADHGSDAARILWSVAGRPARVSPVTTQSLLCDASVVPVLFDGSRPVGVGDAYAAVSSKLRAALVARDGGCRFPGCGAPVGWCDAHHIVPRLKGGPTTVENLVLLCRRCHRRVHRRRWKISLRDDGVMEFATHRDRFESPPHRARRE